MRKVLLVLIAASLLVTSFARADDMSPSSPATELGKAAQKIMKDLFWMKDGECVVGKAVLCIKKTRDGKRLFVSKVDKYRGPKGPGRICLYQMRFEAGATIDTPRITCGAGQKTNEVSLRFYATQIMKKLLKELPDLIPGRTAEILLPAGVRACGIFFIPQHLTPLDKY